MRILRQALFASSILIAPVLAQGQETHIAVMIDGSGSFDFVHDHNYADRLTQDLLSRLPELEMRDLITVAPIGDYSTKNQVKEVRVSKRFRPEQVKPSLRKLVTDFPNALKKMGEPSSTNILGALDKMARRMNCANTSGHVFVLSDGIETGQDFTLPSKPIFEGCESFAMLGVMGLDPAETQELGAFWMTWCKAAGFIHCDWLS